MLDDILITAARLMPAIYPFPTLIMMLQNLAGDTIAKDIALVQQIDVVPELLQVVLKITGMGFSAVARVTDKKWVACAVNDQIEFGLKPGGELILETTICHEIRQSGIEVVIDHVAKDPLFRDHHTPAMYGFQSYISVPIWLANGEFFGTLCAIDPNPAKLQDQTVISMFKLFANLIAKHIGSMRELEDQKNLIKIRDQFIGMLSHDLQNPLTAITNSLSLLSKTTKESSSLELTQIALRSSKRMQGLIANNYDFTKGLLGQQIAISRALDVDVKDLVNTVIREQLAITPAARFSIDLQLESPANLDGKRIAQLLSNLVSNAAKYGDMRYPIEVFAHSNPNLFTLGVRNRGEKIPEEISATIFEPFARGSEHSPTPGLGLGLFISMEIAKAHHGQLIMRSTDDGTEFTLTIPSA